MQASECDGTGGEPVAVPAEWDTAATVAEAPAAALPWLDRFYAPAEIALLGALSGGERPVADALAAVPGLTPDDLRRMHRRTVVTLSGDGAAVSPASFEERFETWIVFEGWMDLPQPVREALAEWHLVKYLAYARASIDDLRAGRPVREPTGNDCFVLFREAEDIVRRARSVSVRPCACRLTYERCDKPRDVCLWIDGDERGQGWEVSRERALELLRRAERAGLMFTANHPSAAAAWICCCCADCCQPILAAERLAASHLWPQRRYLVTLDGDACTRCATCVERCPFGAWSLTKDAHGGAHLRLAAEACRGCGVCETGCPAGAIAMTPRPS